MKNNDFYVTGNNTKCTLPPNKNLYKTYSFIGIKGIELVITIYSVGGRFLATVLIPNNSIFRGYGINSESALISAFENPYYYSITSEEAYGWKKLFATLNEDSFISQLGFHFIRFLSIRGIINCYIISEDISMKVIEYSNGDVYKLISHG